MGDDIGLWQTLRGVLRAKFGPGALGRIGSLALGGSVTMAALGAVLMFANPWFGLAALVGIFVLLIAALSGCFIYAMRFPTLAAMDGAQIERVLKHDTGAKGLNLAGLPAALEQPLQNPALIDVTPQEARSDDPV